MMKRIRPLVSLLAALMLLCGCSAEAQENLEAGMGLAIPIDDILPALTGYADVPADAWYADAANWALEEGIFDAGTFAGTTPMYRSMVAEALYRAEGRPEISDPISYPDIPTGTRYAAPAAWAAKEGIMSGFADGTFGIETPVTREQMAAILWRWAGSPSAENGQDFEDEDNIASYAKTAVDWTRANGVISGKEGNRFDPKGTLTRAQAAVILHRYLTSDKINRQIELMIDGQTCIVKLLDNPSANALYEMLPLELTFEDFNQTEKIAYPPEKLTTEGGPDHYNPSAGDLCLFAPWGNLCFFYRDFRDSASLIPLGQVESGMDVIAGMTGNFTAAMRIRK